MPNPGAASARPCPVCGASSRRERLLSRDFLKSALEQFLEAPLPADVSLRDYAMCRCPACALEFADPAVPADDAFYRWLDHHGRYHVSERWEWDEVARLVAATGRGATVLEIGAGDAKFLRRLGDEAGARTVAIERSRAAAAALVAQGIEALAGDAAAAALAKRRFDFVLAFHCLEHVVDPVRLLRAMVAYAGPSGRVLFSVPYSPMYFESRWFDPLNHPPHHLSRWNGRSLAELAERCGGRARLALPAPYPLTSRARYSLAIERLGPHWMRGQRWRWLPLRHPLCFGRHLAEQARRERVYGRAAADVVLVEFERDGDQAGRRATIT